MMQNKQMNILFLGDVFSDKGIEIVEQYLPNLIKENNVDFTIAQSENVSGRKGLIECDYLRLKKAGVDAFTLGNHVWSKKDILKIINQNDLIRPANIDSRYPGQGTRIFNVNGMTIRVTSLMGITFNRLLAPWSEEYANDFFDTMDGILEYGEKTDFHFVDFHAETTSEKYVLGLYLDGKIDAFCGTHTHVQTNDAHILPNGTCYITDAGMCGPYDCAIGANFQEVYEKMRFGGRQLFKPSCNASQLNGVLITINTINKENNKISPIKILPN